MARPRMQEVWFRIRRRPAGGWCCCWRASSLAKQSSTGPACAAGRSFSRWTCWRSRFVYLPQTPGFAKLVPNFVAKNYILSDPILQLEPPNSLTAREVRSGRVPLWESNQYAGVPYRWPRFSPFFALRYVFTSPVAIAWRQLFLATVVAGLGQYLFFRHVLLVRFWPAALAAWCHPLTGFFVFWQSYLAQFSIVWLPWMLLAVEMTLCRSPWRWGPVLALLTGLNTIGGQPDLAGQILLASGIYAVGRFVHLYWRRWFDWQALRAVLAWRPPGCSASCWRRLNCCR